MVTREKSAPAAMQSESDAEGRRNEAGGGLLKCTGLYDPKLLSTLAIPGVVGIRRVSR